VFRDSASVFKESAAVFGTRPGDVKSRYGDASGALYGDGQKGGSKLSAGEVLRLGSRYG
jgi:hypothetical protein